MPPSADRSVPEYFDDLAPDWDAKYQRSRFFRARMDAVTRLLATHAADGGTAMDYGCGAGSLLDLLTRHADRAVGTDLSDEMRRVAAERHAERDDIEILPIAEALGGRYRTVLCSSVIEYVDDDAALLGRLADALEPGGRLFISFPSRWGLMQVLQRHVLARRGGESYVDHQKHTYTRADIRRVVEGAGLDVYAIQNVSGLPGAATVGLNELTFAIAEKPA